METLHITDKNCKVHRAGSHILIKKKWSETRFISNYGIKDNISLRDSAIHVTSIIAIPG
jgi:hypothetical protein